MEILIIFLALVVLLDIATFVWGFDSTESVDSSEWSRRRNWDELHSPHH